MKTIAAVAALLTLVALMAAILGRVDATAQQGLRIGVDADPSGNTATILKTIDSCVSVKKGDTFQVDVFVTDVSDLLAWEIYLSFDGDVVNVTDRDVGMFLAASAGSDVWDASDPLPSSGGLYRLGAIDIGLPSTPDSGSGVLVRLTLKAVGSGLSPVILTTLDANSDGKIDLGPQLSKRRAETIGDTNGDGFFDGSILNAQIAVGRDCPARPSTPVVTVTPPTLSPTDGATPIATIIPTVTADTPIPTIRATPTPGSIANPTTTAPSSPTAISTATLAEKGGNGPPWVIAYAAGGVVGALALVAGATVFVRRRRGREG